MITILHGEDITASRNELLKRKSAFVGKDIRLLEGKNVSDDMIVQAFSSQSLFTSDTVVIIEHLFSVLGKKQKRAEELLTLLKEYGQQTECILWEEKELGKALVTKLAKIASIQSFQFPKIMFTFLDELRPGHYKRIISLYRTLLAVEPQELLHALIKKRIFQLFLIRSGGTVSGLQGWQVSRLTNQARLFTMNELKHYYTLLLQAELAMKTGNASMPLSEATERIFLEGAI